MKNTIRKLLTKLARLWIAYQQAKFNDPYDMEISRPIYNLVYRQLKGHQITNAEKRKIAANIELMAERMLAGKDIYL